MTLCPRPRKIRVPPASKCLTFRPLSRARPGDTPGCPSGTPRPLPLLAHRRPTLPSSGPASSSPSPSSPSRASTHPPLEGPSEGGAAASQAKRAEHPKDVTQTVLTSSSSGCWGRGTGRGLRPGPNTRRVGHAEPTAPQPAGFPETRGQRREPCLLTLAMLARLLALSGLGFPICKLGVPQSPHGGPWRSPQRLLLESRSCRACEFPGERGCRRRPGAAVPGRQMAALAAKPSVKGNPPHARMQSCQNRKRRVARFTFHALGRFGHRAGNPGRWAITPGWGPARDTWPPRASWGPPDLCGRQVTGRRVGQRARSR